MRECSRCVTLREANAARSPLTMIFSYTVRLSMDETEDMTREVIGSTRISNRCGISHVPCTLELGCFLLYRALEYGSDTPIDIRTRAEVLAAMI